MRRKQDALLRGLRTLLTALQMVCLAFSVFQTSAVEEIANVLLQEQLQLA